VEEVFRRWGVIWEVVVSGQVLRTTAEHPFWVRGRGWVAARELRVGDELRSHDGQWVAVEGVRDTGREEVVYNCRVAEYHTYFVGDESWPFSVWAHNTYREFRLLESRGIELSDHARQRLAQRMVSRGIREIDVLDAYVYGRLFYDPKHKSYVRYSARTKVAVNLPSNGVILTIFEGGISPRWQHVCWRPGILN